IRLGSLSTGVLAGGVGMASPIRLDRRQGDAFNGRGYARLKAGKNREDWVAGIDDAETAVRLGPETPRLFLDAARIYAQALARIQEQGQEWPSLERREHERRAVDLVRKALTSNSLSLAQKQDIVQDAALMPLRSIPEFRDLARAYAR